MQRRNRHSRRSSLKNREPSPWARVALESREWKERPSGSARGGSHRGTVGECGTLSLRRAEKVS